MKYWILIILMLQFTSVQYGQIIADHTVVDRYDDIPQYYIDEVKKMLVDLAGESHATGYRIGMNLLEVFDSKFQVTTYGTGSPLPYSTSYLRFGDHGSIGEAAFYTSQSAIDTYKSYIGSQNATGNQFTVMGYAWCTDMYYNVTGPTSRDPVYNVSWYGESLGSPSGSRSWGLDAGDYSLTGNVVCMDTYLDAVNQYNQYCIGLGYETKMIFTTGPVDNEGGSGNLEGTHQGYQREVKHDYIRNYVKADNDRILFDYADILCWNNDGEQHITNWNDGGTIRPHVNIHPDNEKDYDASWNVISSTEDGDHIGEVGALRLAKAMWWLLARIAGWNGGTTNVQDSDASTSPSLSVIVTKKEIRIDLDINLGFATVSVYDIQGKLKAVIKNVDDHCVFNSKNLTPGIYLIVISNSRVTKVKKILI